MPALLAEGMPTIVEEEMEAVLVIRDLVDLLAFLVLLEWDTDVLIALVEVEEVLAELEAKLFPWRTSSL